MNVPQKTDVHRKFARDIADPQAHEQGKLTILILPVGPVKQYPILAEFCNRERILWKRVHTFNMDEYLDWQARPIIIP